MFKKLHSFKVDCTPNILYYSEKRNVFGSMRDASGDKCPKALLMLSYETRDAMVYCHGDNSGKMDF